MDENLFFIPFIIAFIFWIIGLRGSWRRTIFLLFISYAAIILAFQNFSSIAKLFTSIFDLNFFDNKMLVVGFGATLLLSLIGLYILYGVLWNPGDSYSPYQPRGEVRFLQSLFTAACGWVLGMFFLICIIKFNDPSLVIGPHSGTPFLWDALRVTLSFTSHLVSPWLVHGPPQFLLELGIF